MNAWWRWVKGANWQHPEGPGSDLIGRENHPVVSRYPGTMRPRMRNGRANGCRPKRNGSSRRREDSSASDTLGGMSLSLAAITWLTHGRVSSPTGIPQRMVSLGLRRSSLSQQMDMVSMTWEVMCGTG
jgi:hypothetical protein